MQEAARADVGKLRLYEHCYENPNGSFCKSGVLFGGVLRIKTSPLGVYISLLFAILGPPDFWTPLNLCSGLPADREPRLDVSIAGAEALKGVHPICLAVFDVIVVLFCPVGDGSSGLQDKARAGCTWTPKAFKVHGCWAISNNFGRSFYILLGFRYLN